MKLRLGILLTLFCTTVVLAPPQVSAHTPSDTFLALKVEGVKITGQCDIALRDLQHALGVAERDAASTRPDHLRLRQQALALDAVARLSLNADGRPLTVRVTDFVLAERREGEYASLPFEAEGAAHPPKSLELGAQIFFALEPQMRCLVRLEQAGQTQTAICNLANPTHRFDLQAPVPKWRQFGAFIAEGVGHIWAGYDHILFLIALLLPAVLCWREGRWHGAEAFRPAFLNVLKIITAFTVAHSITLALAALQIVALPSRLVESAIAISVLLAALNNVLPFFHGRTWPVAFGFGLVHGFGFANALADLGLEKSTLALALVGFNLGVESGQVAIVAVALPLAFRFRHTRGYQRLLLRGGSALVVLLAAIWMAERAFNFKALPF